MRSLKPNWSAISTTLANAAVVVFVGAELHGTILGNREVGKDIMTKLNTQTADRWTGANQREYQQRVQREINQLKADVYRITRL